MHVGRFPSGQREQTVNLPSVTSVVRIHPCPPHAGMAELADALDSGSSDHYDSCRFKSCFPHQQKAAKAAFFFVQFVRKSRWIGAKIPALNGIRLNDSIPPTPPLRDLRTNLHRKELDLPAFSGVFSNRFFAQTTAEVGFMWLRRRGNSRAFPLRRGAASVPSWRTPSASSPGWSVPSATGWS